MSDQSWCRKKSNIKHLGTERELIILYLKFSKFWNILNNTSDQSWCKKIKYQTFGDRESSRIIPVLDSARSLIKGCNAICRY
jgi:predicted nucleic-acid-binding Zn-ribbon protein